MNAKDFERLLAGTAGVSLGEADQRMRRLRSQGLVTYGPRGPYAPDIEPAQAAFMILFMVSRRVMDAAGVGTTASKLKPLVGEATGHHASLAHLIAHQILFTDVALVSQLAISEDGDHAWTMHQREGHAPVEMVWGDQAARAAVEADPSAFLALREGFFGRRFVIGGGALRQLGLDLQDQAESPWERGADLMARLETALAV